MNFLKRGMLISLSTAMVAVLLLLLRASPASAGNCLQDVYGSKHLNCTANDVSIAQAINPRDPVTGKTIGTCFAGSKFSFLVDFQVVTTATARENIGLYLGTTPGGSALSGTCNDNIISPLHAPTFAGPPAGGCTQTGGTGLCLGSNQYFEAPDPQPDNCGDTTSAFQDLVTVELDDVTCPAVGTTFTLPDCTSWQQPGGTIQCNSTPGSGWPFPLPATAIPGSPSKCNCSVVSIPITPISASIGVAKTCAAPGTSTYAKTCSAPEPGGSFNYKAVVTNNTTCGTSACSGNFGDVTINQLCDDKFGNIFTVSNLGLNPCAAGSLCTDKTPGSTCATNIVCPLPATFSNPNSVTCTFSGSVTGTEGSVMDTVTANGVDHNGNALPPPNTGSATATLTEGSATASVLKSLDNTRACATVRYKVVVTNGSAAGTDETETLSALNDSPDYGDITTLHSGNAIGNGAVLGTTCGQSSTASGGATGFGLGTLSGSAGAGTLSTTLAVNGGSYTCLFDGQFCAAITPTTACPNGGLTHNDTITATLADDASEGHTVAGNVSNTLTVDTCFSSH